MTHPTGSVARNIYAWRIARNWTQAQAAEKCDMSERLYGQMERAENRNPTLRTLLRLCEGFECDLLQLFAEVYDEEKN